MSYNVSGVIHAVTSLQEFIPTEVEFVLFPFEIYLNRLDISQNKLSQKMHE